MSVRHQVFYLIETSKLKKSVHTFRAAELIKTSDRLRLTDSCMGIWVHVQTRKICLL